MAETYCGKTCLECGQKEILNCPGCKLGPGKQYGGDCELAKCCRAKGHQECSSCSFKGNCGTLRGKDRMPEYRIKRIEAERCRLAAIAKRAPILGRWLWILFWLIIPSSIAALLTNNTIAAAAPSVFAFGQLLSVICSFAYGFILIRLNSEEERYRTAGICELVGGLIVALTYIFGGSPIWALLTAIPSAIFLLVGEYNEFMAHATVLTGLDNESAEKWCLLWKWYIGVYGATLGSLLLMIIIPLLGALVAMAALLGLLVISILKLVYLYRTAKIFREYQAKPE
jgi:hypothetical protein